MLVEEFEKDYFTRRQRTPKSQSTWNAEYGYVFKRLPQEAFLTTELIFQTIETTEPDTRNRKRFCQNLSILAKFAGLSIDLKPYVGKYSCLKPAPRQLPTDSLIEECYSKVKPTDWRWFFGMLAAYGLRPHEVFHLDYEKLREGDECLRVLDGKTGSRLAFPFKPEWFTSFHLTDVNVPKCTGKNNGDLGNRVCHAFTRLEIPCKPYDLRHAWAIRSMTYGLDITLAAQQMGHSLMVHSRVYHQWISERVHRQAYEAVLRGR